MGIVRIKDRVNEIMALREGVCPRWGFAVKSGCKNALTRGKWNVDISGNISYNEYYNIEKERLTEPDWITHLMRKSWFTFDEFMPIYLQACVNAGIEEITIRTHRKH